MGRISAHKRVSVPGVPIAFPPLERNAASRDWELTTNYKSGSAVFSKAVNPEVFGAQCLAEKGVLDDNAFVKNSVQKVYCKFSNFAVSGSSVGMRIPK